MSDCRFGVSPVNYPDPDPDHWSGITHLSAEDMLNRNKLENTRALNVV